MQRADSRTVVYCDPPYAPLTATANFTAYHTNSFNLEQQVLLAQKAESLMKKRIPVLISNHRTPLTQEWYKNAAETHIVKVRRSISSNGGTRKRWTSYWRSTVRLRPNKFQGDADEAVFDCPFDSVG